MTSVARKRATTPVALDTKKLETRLAKAKTGLVLGHPFFGTLALNMAVRERFGICPVAIYYLR